MAVGGCERDHTSSSLRLLIESQTKAARVQVAQPDVWPGATLHQCACAEGKGQEAVTGREAAPQRK